MTVDELSRIANRLRLDVVETVHDAGDGHPGPCMSVADIMAVLFFDEMKLDPANPRWPERDRFILSKGHACPILYAALARRGYFPVEELKGLRSLGSFLQGHPDSNKIPGVDTVSGSLGNGVAIGLGMALGCKMQGIENYVYVIVGDDEEEEGIIWEAAMAAAKFNAGNLIVFADLNNHQSGGRVTDLSSLYPVADKWKAFHWHVQEIDGHDIAEILDALDQAKACKGKPTAIIANTIKGKGFPFAEGKAAYHNAALSEEEYKLARELVKKMKEEA